MNLHLILIIAVLAILYFWYSSIITRKNKVSEALSGVDVHLKKRSDLIPNILTIAKKFMEHEEQIFSEVTRLRETLNQSYDTKNIDEVKSHLASSSELSLQMSNLMLRAENYPDLKSNQNMLQAQQSYNEVEEQIAAARRFYNSAVGDLRNSIQIFPGNLIAALVGVKDMPMFEATEAEKASVNAAKFL